MRKTLRFVTYIVCLTVITSCAKITSIQPNPTAPGSKVIIKGWGFGSTQSNSKIQYDGSTLATDFWSSRKIIAEIDSGQRAGSFDLKLNLKDKKNLSKKLAIKCVLPTCNSILLPHEGGEVGLPGVVAKFSGEAFSGGRQIRLEATQNPDTEILYESMVGYLTAGIRIPKEIRVNTGPSPPLAGEVTISVSIPDSQVKTLPTGSSIIPFVQLDDFTDTELQTSFVAVEPDFKGGQLIFKISSDKFTQSPDGSYEAIIILAPVFTQSHEVSNDEVISTCDSVQIRVPLLGSPGVNDLFNPTAGHLGVDFAVADGTVVVAADDGIVVSSPGVPGNPQIRDCYPTETRCTSLGLKQRGAGNYVIVKHGTGANARYTTYFHLSGDSDFPEIGGSIKKGQILGLSDSTGGVTGPHLHFEYRKARFGKHIDPKSCFDCITCIESYVSMLPNGCPNDPSNYQSFGVTNSCDPHPYMHYHCFNPSYEQKCADKCGTHLVAWFCKNGQECQGNGCSPSCSGGATFRVHTAPCP